MSRSKSEKQGSPAHSKRVLRISESHVMVYVSKDKIDIQLTPKIALFCEKIKHKFPKLIDIIPSYHSVLIEFHPLHTDVEKLIHYLAQQLEDFDQLTGTREPKTIELPVYYHPEVAPDLNDVAARHGLSVEQVIVHHSQVEYTICAIGFAPGFAFLGSVDKAIATPRHTEPRLHVAKGSVGIADEQTAVYPLDSPGGWQIIGNCPVDLTDPNFQVGDKVMFKPVSKQSFIEMGGSIAAHSNKEECA